MPPTIKTLFSWALPVLLLALGAVAMMNRSDVDGAKANQLIQEKGALLLDVRTVQEFADGHIFGAVNIPVQELDRRLDELAASKDRDVVVYCRSGARSARAKSMLKQAGFSKVHDLGAMSRWNAGGAP